MPKPNITSDTIRENLLKRSDAFRKAHGYSLSRFGDEAVGDSKFLSRVRSGGNFTIETYQRVIDWMDTAEKAAA